MRHLFHLLSLLIVLLAACTPADPSLDELPTPTPFPTPVKPTFIVQRGEVVREAILSGRVTPVASREIFFAVNGRVDQVYVQVGDTVKAGQLLADLSELAELKDQWAAALLEAEAQEQATRNIVRRAEIDLEIAQLTLEQYKLERRSEFEIQIQALQVERAQMALDEVNADPALHTASAKVKEIEAAMADAQLFAPSDGAVIAAVDPGQSVRTSTTAFVIGDASRLEASVTAAKDVLEELIENTEVIVKLESQPGEAVTGVIRQLPFPYGSGPSQTGDDTVRITLDAADGYKTGDRVTVTVVLARKSDVLWLPPEAVRSAGSRTFVFVQTDSDPKQVNITLGIETRQRVEIVEGLSEGQIVIGP